MTLLRHRAKQKLKMGSYKDEDGVSPSPDFWSGILGLLKSTLESHNVNYNISVLYRLFRGAAKSDNVRQKWILYIKMCRFFLIKRYTRFPKKCTPQHTPKGTFGGQIPQIFYAPRFARRSASPSLGRERDNQTRPNLWGPSKPLTPWSSHVRRGRTPFWNVTYVYM